MRVILTIEETVRNETVEAIANAFADWLDGQGWTIEPMGEDGRSYADMARNFVLQNPDLRMHG